MFEILTLNKISKNGLDRLDSAKFTCSDSAENPDAILVRSASMHEMELSEKTVAIARAGAGVNNIPIPACSDKGVVVFNTPGANANAVKELVLCSLFMASRKVAASLDWCKTLKGEGDNVGKLVEKGKSNFAGPEILGKTLGIVGLGAIGALVARDAKALGMDIIAYDPFAQGKTDIELVELDELFAKSDYITLHAPLNDGTRGMINAETIAKMKDGVRILNFARGELVASKDIVDALASGKAGAYITDFPTDEQLGAEGVTALPHLGASTPESEENCAMMAADEVSAYLLRGEIKNSVNLPNTCLAESFAVRTCIIHKENADDFAAKAEVAAKADGANVAAIFTANKKDMGYTVIDTDKPFNAEIDGAIRVRVI
ncbi:MAG: 3-phosphoglycerate dehydrogenase [Ruminococcaceae bacterium]|nr:3-phosphoglycerate dehydrogenase [Oscillospiraceae bacterium]